MASTKSRPPRRYHVGSGTSASESDGFDVLPGRSAAVLPAASSESEDSAQDEYVSLTNEETAEAIATLQTTHKRAIASLESKVAELQRQQSRDRRDILELKDQLARLQYARDKRKGR
ncbi:hypothetical protein IMZ48_14335 [Candidatus Bathyarchaeota archaeon]|nr:hypothetical protein [Candidatus Bathyarchaeota archaeon]